jgi:hypothetical protein
MPTHASGAPRKTVQPTGVSRGDGRSSRLTSGSGSHPGSRRIEAKAASGGRTGPSSPACWRGCAAGPPGATCPSAMAPGTPCMAGALVIVQTVRSTASSRPCRAASMLAASWTGICGVSMAPWFGPVGPQPVLGKKGTCRAVRSYPGPLSWRFLQQAPCRDGWPWLTIGRPCDSRPAAGVAPARVRDERGAGGPAAGPPADATTPRRWRQRL